MDRGHSARDSRRFASPDPLTQMEQELTALTPNPNPYSTLDLSAKELLEIQGGPESDEGWTLEEWIAHGRSKEVKPDPPTLTLTLNLNPDSES